MDMNKYSQKIEVKIAAPQNVKEPAKFQIREAIQKEFGIAEFFTFEFAVLVSYKPENNGYYFSVAGDVVDKIAPGTDIEGKVVQIAKIFRKFFPGCKVESSYSMSRTWDGYQEVSD